MLDNENHENIFIIADVKLYKFIVNIYEIFILKTIPRFAQSNLW